MRKEKYLQWAQAHSGECSLGITIYGGPNFNGAEKQLRLANGNVKDKFSSVGREQIPAYLREGSFFFCFQRNRGSSL